MSDSEDENQTVKSFEEIHDEIQKYKRNPETSGMFVSGWDDADQDVEVVKDPKGEYYKLTYAVTDTTLLNHLK